MARIQNLHLEQDGFVLDVPEWSFPDKGITAIWGASGAGKTTLLHCLAGIFRPPHLKFQLFDRDVAGLSLKDRRVGLVFQNHLLFEHLTVKENILFSVNARRSKLSEWSDVYEKLIERLELRSLLEKNSTEISGGEKQRVGLARALMASPQIMLLDEPMSSLDEGLRDSAREVLSELSTQFKIPFLIVTHDFEDVQRLAQNLAVMANGQIVASGETAKLVDRPPSLQAAELLPFNQILKVGNERFVFKPWHVLIGQQGPFQGRVLQSLADGPGWRAQLEMPDGQRILAWSQSASTFSTKDLKFDLLASALIKFTA